MGNNEEGHNNGAKGYDNLCLNSSAQDSIVALEALLEINSVSVGNLPVSEERKKKSTSIAIAALPSNNNNHHYNRINNIKMEQGKIISYVPRPFPFLNNATPSSSSSSSLSSSINRPASNKLKRPNNSLCSPSIPNLIGPSPPIFPFMCSKTQQIPNIALSNTSSTRETVMEFSATASSSSGRHHHHLNKEITDIKHVETVVSSTAEQASVRSKEIEAALRSKPQRGRRRDNLSVEERQELTRTRNRAHARSTRNRKKARYEELLEKEKKYDSIMQRANISNKRRECVIEFMKLRSNDGSNLSLSTSYDNISLLIDKDIFEYSTMPPMIISSISSKINSNARKTGLDLLKYHDECLIEILPKYGKKVTYEYKIRDEIDGIAIMSDLCYAMYDVVVSNNENSDDGKGPTGIVTTMLSGFININFQSNNSKIISIKESLLNPTMLMTSTLSSATNATKTIATNKNGSNYDSNNTASCSMLPIKQNDNINNNNSSASSSASASQSFPNVISWNNICGDQQNTSSATNTSSSATSDHNANNNQCVVENNFCDTSSPKMHEGEENRGEKMESIGLDDDNKSHKRVKTQTRYDRTNCCKDRDAT